MGKKESRGLDRARSQADVGSSPSNDVFKSLFGTGSVASSSIFSDENPFKRKLDEHQGTGDHVEMPKVNKNCSDENVDVVDRGVRRKKNRITFAMENEIKEEGSGEKDGRKKKRKREEVAKEFEGSKVAVDKIEDAAATGSVAIGTKRKSADREDVDAMVMKDEGEEGFDDEEKLLRTVFIGNLPLKVKKKFLLKEFSKFGEIDSIRIRSVPLTETKIPRKGAVLLKKFNDSADNVHAYVVFKTQQSAEDALSYNMTEVAGKHIRVDRACPPRKKLKGDMSPLFDTQRTVFLGNLPFDVKDEEIYQLFSSIKELASSLEGVRVIRDPNIGLGKGFAYLLLKTKEAAKLALRHKNLTIRGRELRVVPAKQNPTASKANTLPNKKRPSPSIPAVPSGESKKARGVMSYQGLRSNKDENINKLAAKKGLGKGKSMAGEQFKESSRRKQKRPAVAAKKRKQLASRENGMTKQNKKRKLDSRTPDSHKQKRGAKRFRQNQ